MQLRQELQLLVKRSSSGLSNKPFLPNAVVYVTVVCDCRRFRDRSRCCCARGNKSFGFLESKSLPQLMAEQQEICAHLKNGRPNREIPDLPNLESRHTGDQQR